MNREQIIQMAREAGALPIYNHPEELTLIRVKYIERFAKLVAEHEREACAEIAEEESMRGLPDEKPKGTHLKVALAQIVCGTFIAEAIRERGQAIEQPKVRTGNCLRVGVCASEGHKIAPPLQPLTWEKVLEIGLECANDNSRLPYEVKIARAIEAAHGIKENT